MSDDDPTPSAPYIVTVMWSVGDALVVEYPDLQPWEARAALEEAAAILLEAEEREPHE